MRFLKKVSYQDIVGENRNNQFHYYENVTEKYKEFELFLTQADLSRLYTMPECLVNMITTLKRNGAVISAIHCPESMFNTCNEEENNLSSNYLSLCEVIRDSDSRDILKKVFELADKICEKQVEKEWQHDDINDDNSIEDDEISIGNIKKSIIVILHEGCEKGCLSSDCEKGVNCNTNAELIANIMKELIEDLKIKSTILIALENVTPFYSTVHSEISVGANCGWKSNNQKSKKDLFRGINEKLKDTKLQFGACIDFCHIMVSSKILGEKKTKSGVLDEYFNSVDYGDYIFLFHVSNCGGDLSHGQLFQLEDEEDKNALEKIRFLCNQYAPEAPITFEMADGTDVEKAALNYEHIMFYFSNKHMFGEFNKMLTIDANKELKDLFDNLFVIYSYDKKSVFEITNALWRVKQIILNNTFNQGKESRLFGVDFDRTKVNLSLVRLKAYVYYTRFCNLANYLADNYYSGEKCIWNNTEDKATDFGLAMKYFIFNDKIHQCVYTGIQYKFLIDFLPKRESFVRFNDGINVVNELKIENNKDAFGDIVKKIPEHISGDSIRNGQADFYSVGKNLGQCLFKYFDSSHNDWSIRIYKKEPVNYVDYYYEDNLKKRYSIQAFMQMVLEDKILENKKVDVSLDISRFASGRDGETTDTLQGFLKYFKLELLEVEEKDKETGGISKTKVASISDGEILFTKLTGEMFRCKLNKYEGLILKKIYHEMISKNKLPCRIDFKEDYFVESADEKEIGEIKRIIERINDNINDDKKDYYVWTLLKIVKNNFDLNKSENQGVDEKKSYKGSDDSFYDSNEQYIGCIFGEEKNE